MARDFNQDLSDEEILEDFAPQHFHNLSGCLPRRDVDTLAQHLANRDIGCVHRHTDRKERILRRKVSSREIRIERIAPDVCSRQQKAMAFLPRSEVRRHPHRAALHQCLHVCTVGPARSIERAEEGCEAEKREEDCDVDEWSRQPWHRK
jgi:hypothetical protein